MGVVSLESRKLNPLFLEIVYANLKLTSNSEIMHSVRCTELHLGTLKNCEILQREGSSPHRKEEGLAKGGGGGLVIQNFGR